MIRTTGIRGRSIVLALLVFAVVAFLFYQAPNQAPFGRRPTLQQGALQQSNATGAVLTGHAIAPKLGNATAKAELGRAAWKVLHTTFARFPKKPTDEEKEALRSYVHLFQRLYPCGECAEHFGHVLAKYPPQVSSRTAAVMWGCFVHNVVNKRLNKAEFDCKDIGDAYDCGCGDDEPESSSKDAPA